MAYHGITPEELKKAQRGFKASEIYLREQLHYYVMMRAEWLAHATPEFLKDFLQNIENQDLEQVNAVARKYFKEMYPLITISGPQQEEGGAEKYEIKRYKMKEEHASSINIDKRILDNGMTVIAKREEASKIFAIHLLMKNRVLNEPEGKTGIADFTHRMLLKGTTLMNSVELSEAMKEIGAKAKVIDNPYIPYDDYYTSPLYSYIRFETLSDHYHQGLKLLKEIVFHPAFPKSEVSKVASEMSNVIKKNEEKLSTKAKNEFLSKIFSISNLKNSVSKLGNSVYGTHETISSITREDLLSFHQNYFSPQNMIVSIVSNHPVEKVLQSMEEIFGKIEQHGGETVTMPEIKATHGGDRTDLVGEKEQSYVYAGYLLQIDKEDITTLSLANAILSDRMAFQLRENQGLAYRIGSTMKLYGNAVLFYASMGTRPENIEKAVEGILKEIGSFADSDLAESELEKTINSMIGRYAMRRVPGINRAYFLGLSEFQGLGYAYDLDFVSRIKRIDEDQIKKAAKKYFDTSKIILLITK